MGSKGVLYYAIGEEYVQQAELSAESLKSHSDINVTLFTDVVDISAQCFDQIYTIDSTEYPFFDRIEHFKKMPYDKNIYLDTDTYICGNISPIFDLLERVDIAAAFNESRDTAAEHMKYKTIDLNAPDTFPEYQCGVIGFCDNERVDELFNDWRRRYRPYRDENLIDQPHFREALFNVEVSIGTLPTEYNTLLNHGGYLYGPVKLLHYAGDNRPFVNKLDSSADFDTVAERLNRGAPTNRVFYYDNLQRLRVRDSRGRGIFGKIVTSLYREGVVETAQVVLEKMLQSVPNQHEHRD